jgi:hypothetical protein
MGPCNPALPGSAGMPTSADAIDQVEGLPQLFLFGLQHVLVMYAGTVAVPLILGQAARLLTEAELARCTLYTSTEPCAMCAGAIYWTGIGRVVFALAETGLSRYTGSHTQNPTLDLPCREVFARGQKPIVVAGPLLEDEAGKVHEGFWVS